MFRLRLSSALLLAATCLLVTAERTVTCYDENSVHRLSCNNEVISVQTALFGRTDKDTCSEGLTAQDLGDTQCSLPGVVDVIKKRCDGKKLCELSTTEIRTSDPCVGTYKYLETSYTCIPAIHLVACEHSYAHLECDAGQVLLVYGADYGRRDHTTCSYKLPTSQIENIYCSSPTSKVGDSCNWKNNCTIKASDTVFGDPCVGTYKYLEVAYTCLYQPEQQ